MYSDQLYKRSLGMTYDPEAAQREVANGVAGYTGDFDRLNGFEQTSSDLFIEASYGDDNEFRLQEIEFELAALLEQQEQSDEDIEQLLLLGAEKVIRLEADVEKMLASEPKHASVLKDFFMTRLMERAEAGQPVDAEMFIESSELAEKITEQYPDYDAKGLLEIAEQMEALIIAQLTLEQYADQSQEYALA